MSEQQNKNRLAKVQHDNPGLLTGMTRTLQLVLKLLADKRVNIFLKLLPVGTLVYLVSPLDAAIPVIDDAFIIGLGTYMFIELCPPEVVQEHQERLAGTATARSSQKEEGEVIDLLPSNPKDK